MKIKIIQIMSVFVGFGSLMFLFIGGAVPAFATVVYDGAMTGGVTVDDSYIIDYDQSASGPIDLQFGNSGRYLRWNGTKFQVSNDLDLNSNQITSARLENVTAFPGGSAGIGVAGTGRIVQLTQMDNVAPGCTSPSCPAGTYSWNGGAWVPLSGTTTTINASKIVTVGPSGRDYTTIAGAAAYLNTLSGGEVWIDPGTYPITTALDLSNIRLKGADTSLTTLSISGAGKVTVKDTKFEDAKITFDAAATSAMALDVKYVSTSNSSIEFNRMDFVVNGSKVLIDSTSTTAPVAIVAMQNSSQSAGTGTIVKAYATSALNTSLSKFTVIDLLSSNALKMVDWPVTIVGGSNVITSGTITTVPDRTILVSPGMNIQAAIDSLGTNGGVVKLLIGTHDITQTIVINNNNIELTGEGPGTILRVQSSTWIGGTLGTNAAIRVGAADGSTPKKNVSIKNFTLQVEPNVHGIMINGGQENKVVDMIVQSIGTKTNTRTGIVFTDGSTTAGSRFVASRNIVNSNVIANSWVDGVHMDGDAAIAGALFGHGNGITDSIISEIIVYTAKETSFAFSKVSASGIFSNRARDVGINANALGMYVNNAEDVMVINNTLEGNGVNSATGINLNNNVVNSSFIGNAVRGTAGMPYVDGFKIDNATSTGNIITGNQFAYVTNKITDNGTNTKLETQHHRAIVSPAVTDDISKGYDIGTVWINTSTQAVFVSVKSTAGTAVWTQLSSGAATIITGTTSNVFTLDTDNTGGNVQLQFGQTLAETFGWDGTNSRFSLSNKLVINGDLGIAEGGTNPTYYTIFQGADQSADITYTLPDAQGDANTILMNDGTGALTWKGVVNEVISFVSPTTANVVWTNQPAALTEFLNSTRYRIRADLSNARQIRLVTNVQNAGSANAELRLQYSTDQTNWYYVNGITGPSVAINATGVRASSFVDLTAAAQADVYLRVIGINGNGNADPAFGSISIEVK